MRGSLPAGHTVTVAASAPVATKQQATSIGMLVVMQTCLQTGGACVPAMHCDEVLSTSSALPGAWPSSNAVLTPPPALVLADGPSYLVQATCSGQPLPASIALPGAAPVAKAPPVCPAAAPLASVGGRASPATRSTTSWGTALAAGDAAPSADGIAAAAAGGAAGASAPPAGDAAAAASGSAAGASVAGAAAAAAAAAAAMATAATPGAIGFWITSRARDMCVICCGSCCGRDGCHCDGWHALCMNKVCGTESHIAPAHAALSACCQLCVHLQFQHQRRTRKAAQWH